MKKLLLLLFIGFLGTFNLTSQNPIKSGDFGWNLVSGGTEQDLNKVHFAGPSTVYIAGNEGLIMKSSNGGESWSSRVIPSVSNFWCVFATSPEDAYIGAWDTIYTTHNGGASWTGIQSPLPNYIINDIQFLNPLNGVAVLPASACITTADGGDSWTVKGGVGAIEDFFGSHFLNENYGFAVGDCGLIAKTIDGGENWEAYRWDEWLNWSCIQIYDVFLTSQNTGFAVADSGFLFKTTDGGVNWSKTILGEETDKLKSICFVNSTIGYIAGSHGKIFKTTDGGENWFLEFVPTENDLNSIHFVSENLGYAVGALGTILIYGDPKLSGKDSENLVPDGQVSVYPNPAGQTLSIVLNLPEAAAVKVDLLQMNGQMLENLANKMIQAGKQTMQFSLDRIPKGTYLCRITARSYLKQVKIMVL